MKKYIVTLLGLSCIGASIAFTLMYQHFFSQSNFVSILCGGGLDNPCSQLSHSGMADLFGLPVAGYGLIGYFLIIITAILTLISGERWHLPCFAILAMVAAGTVIADVVLGSILIYLKISCRLCFASYIVNIMICVFLFLWYVGIKEEGKGLKTIYIEFVSLVRDPRNRAVSASYILIVLFMVLFVWSLSAYMGARGSGSELTDGKRKKFEEFYYSLKQEDLSLPESTMSLGESGAPVMIAVFTDFLCTACMKFYETEQYLMSRFPGKIRVDYYNFPLDTTCNQHVPNTVYPNSCIAAQVFNAAAGRGIFVDLLAFHYNHYRDNLKRFTSGDVLVSAQQFFKEQSSGKEYGAFIGEALAEKAKISVYDDIAQGHKLNVRAVPTLFINGKRIEGVPDTELLVFILSQELKEK